MANADPAIVTGVFTLGGVLLTTVTAFVVAQVGRRQQREDAKAARADRRFESLRIERLTVYPELLATFDKWNNRVHKVASETEAGTLPSIAADADVFQIIGADVELMGEIEGIVLRALLVADDAVARSIRDYDTFLGEQYLNGRMGRPVADMNLQRDDLIAVMRAETRLGR